MPLETAAGVGDGDGTGAGTGVSVTAGTAVETVTETTERCMQEDRNKQKSTGKTAVPIILQYLLKSVFLRFIKGILTEC